MPTPRPTYTRYPTPVPTTAAPTTKKPTPAPSTGPTSCRCVAYFGVHRGVGNFAFRDDGLVYGSLPAVNPASEHYDLAWAAGATLKDGFNWDDYLTAWEYFSKISTKQAAASSFAAATKNDYAALGPGAAGKNGVIANDGNMTAAVNALQTGGSTPPNKYNYNITDMDKRCIYRMEPEPSAAPTPKPSIPPGAPAPTPAPTVTQAVVEVSAAVVLTGIDPTDFNADPQQVEAFAQTILAILPAALAGADVTDIRAKSARRRRLQASSVEVRCTIVVRQDATAATDGGDSILSDVTSSLTAAVSSGEFLQRIIEEAAAAGGSAAMAFMTIDVDVAASTDKIAAAVLTLVITTPAPVVATPAPVVAPAAAAAAGGGGGGGGGSDGGMLIIIIVVVVVVVIGGGAAAFLVKKKGGRGAAKIEASPHN